MHLKFVILLSIFSIVKPLQSLSEELKPWVTEAIIQG